MPRTSRVTPGGMMFHVLNRGVGRQRLFDKPADYEAFELMLEETLVKQPMTELAARRAVESINGTARYRAGNVGCEVFVTPPASNTT